MRPHIILEGPDCTGKTSMANDLITRGWKYQHFSQPGDAFAEYTSALLAASEPTVFDRLYHGEFVYGPVKRGSSQLSTEQYHLLENLRKARGVRTVLCGVNYRQALERWLVLKHKRSEYLVSEEEYQAIWSGFRKAPLKFDHIVEGTVLPRQVWDCEQARLPLGYTGSVEAPFLIVGERPHPEDPNLAFYGTTRSSKFLHRCLEQAGFKQGEVAFVNAFGPEGMPNTLLQFHSVIALGNIAADTCKAQGVTGRRIPHPTFWLKFHYTDPTTYVGLLRRIRYEGGK